MPTGHRHCARTKSVTMARRSASSRPLNQPRTGSPPTSLRKNASSIFRGVLSEAIYYAPSVPYKVRLQNRIQMEKFCGRGNAIENTKGGALLPRLLSQAMLRGLHHLLHPFFHVLRRALFDVSAHPPEHPESLFNTPEPT